MMESVLIDLDSTVFNTDECVTNFLRDMVDCNYRPNIISYDFNKTASYLFSNKGTDIWRTEGTADWTPERLDLGITRSSLIKAHADKRVFDRLEFYPGVVDSIRALINLGIHVTFKTRVSGTDADTDIILTKYSLLREAFTGSYNHFDLLLLGTDSTIDLAYDAIFDDNINEYINIIKNKGKMEGQFYLMDKSYNTDGYLNALFDCKTAISDEVYKVSRLNPYVKVDNLVEGIKKFSSTLSLVY